LAVVLVVVMAVLAGVGLIRAHPPQTVEVVGVVLAAIQEMAVLAVKGFWAAVVTQPEALVVLAAAVFAAYSLVALAVAVLEL